MINFTYPIEGMVPSASQLVGNVPVDTIVALTLTMEKKMNYKRIVEQLEVAMQSEETWRKTWQSQPSLHKNWVSNHTYSGCNQMMCMISSWEKGFTNPLWLTWNQVQELGGTVKGQKATPIIFFGQAKDKADQEKTYKFCLAE